MHYTLGWFFGLFNRVFSAGTAGYGWVVGRLLRASAVVLVVYGGLLGLTWWGFERTPRGFIPQQDMGYLMVIVQLPDSASTERTDAVMRQMEQIALKDPGILHATSVVGQSFAATCGFSRRSMAPSEVRTRCRVRVWNASRPGR